MKTVGKLIEKVLEMPGIAAGIFFLMLACSTVKEQGEPEVANTTEITTDEQRKAIYDRGGTYSPQNANPIPPSNKLGLNEKASEINRKQDIESPNDQNAPSNTPVEERPRQLRQVGNDSLPR